MRSKKGLLDTKEIIEYYKLIAPPFWKRGIFISFLLLISGLTILPFPFISRYIIDVVIVDGNISLLVLLIGALILFFILDSVLTIVKGNLETKFNQDVSIFLRKRISEKLKKVDDAFFRKTGSGTLLNRFINDVESSQSVLFETATQLFVSIVQMVFGFISMIYLDYKMALLIIVLIPFYVYTLKRMGPKIEKKSTGLIKSRQRFYGIIEEFIQNIVLIKDYVADLFVNKKLDKTFEDYKKANVGYSVTEIVSSEIISFIASIGSLIVFGYGGYRIINGTFTIGTLIAFTTLIDLLFDPLSEVISIGMTVESVAPNIKNILGLLDTKEEDVGPVEHKTVDSGKIEFKNVSLILDKKQIIDNLSFRINDKEMVSFVGQSGAGKSTIICLLTGLWDPTAGEILVDNKNIGKIEVRMLRKSIAIVSQEPHFFKTSVLDNIRLGNDKIKIEKIREVARHVKIDQIIMRRPLGYHTIINTEEENFSPGQLQRIALVRAIAHDAKILVLDEFTSALDPETEHAILQVIKKLKGKKTILVVAHHEVCIKGSDKIIVLKKGRIAERGTYSQLVGDKRSEFNKIFK